MEDITGDENLFEKLKRYLLEVVDCCFDEAILIFFSVLYFWAQFLKGYKYRLRTAFISLMFWLNEFFEHKKFCKKNTSFSHGWSLIWYVHYLLEGEGVIGDSVLQRHEVVMSTTSSKYALINMFCNNRNSLFQFSCDYNKKCKKDDSKSNSNVFFILYLFIFLNE